MVFSSVIFLFVFFPITFLVYTITKSLKLKNIILALASLVFYAIGEPVAVLIMLISVAVNYFLAIAISREKAKRAALVASVIYNLGILFVFKYLNFTTQILDGVFGSHLQTHILLPVGISFFTFQIMSYVIDVYRGVTKPQRSFLSVLLYISFFPQLIAGPIVKYHDIEKQLAARTQTADKVYWGIKRFSRGLAKKVLIADILAVFVDYVYSLDMSEMKSVSALTALAAGVGYTLQIYFDFSGYSDMAIGMASMFGFRLKENFNYPYTASSIKEFWRRWHISLSTWFKEYVYIPLGGNRKGTARTYLNKCIVFLLTGIWHGANFTFLLWGVIHGFFITLEDFIKLPKNKFTKALAHIYTLAVVCLAFMIFRADSVTQAFTLIGRLFTGWGNTNSAVNSVFQSYFTPVTIIAFVLALVFSAPVLPKAAERVKNKKALEYAEGICCLALLIVSAVFLISNGYSPNIYNQF